MIKVNVDNTISIKRFISCLLIYNRVFYFIIAYTLSIIFHCLVVKSYFFFCNRKKKSNFVTILRIV